MKTRIVMHLVVFGVISFAGTVWGSTEGLINNFFGSNAGTNTTGNYNNFFGGWAGYNNTTGAFNNFFGSSAGFSNTTGDYNSFFGNLAGYNNTLADNNSFFGAEAGRFNTIGNSNSFFGTQAGQNNTQGSSNTFIGYNAGNSNTIGYNNSFLGSQAGQNNTQGGSNTFIGFYAGNSNTTGVGNTFLGYTAGSYNTTGSYNVFLGRSAGEYETGANRLYISNTNTSTPLIYGEFDNEYLEVNGDLSVVGYVQLDLTTNSPPSADCDSPSEYGREKFDASNEILYICAASGWKSMGQAPAVENDFNGDGISDVLVRNTDNGRWHMYLMDGTSNPTLVSRINMYEFSVITFQD